MLSETERQFLAGYTMGSWVSRDEGCVKNIADCRNIVKCAAAKIGHEDQFPFSMGMRAAYLSAWGF